MQQREREAGGFARFLLGEEVKSWGTGGGLHSQQLVQIAMPTTKVITTKAIKF